MHARNCICDSFTGFPNHVNPFGRHCPQAGKAAHVQTASIMPYCLLRLARGLSDTAMVALSCLTNLALILIMQHVKCGVCAYRRVP